MPESEKYHKYCPFCFDDNGKQGVWHVWTDFKEGRIKTFEGKEIEVEWCERMWNSYHFIFNALIREQKKG